MKVYVASTSSINPPIREVLIIAAGKKAVKWNWQQHLLNTKDPYWVQGWVREATDDDVTRIIGDTVHARILPTQPLS